MGEEGETGDYNPGVIGPYNVVSGSLGSSGSMPRRAKDAGAGPIGHNVLLFRRSGVFDLYPDKRGIVRGLGCGLFRGIGDTVLPVG